MVAIIPAGGKGTRMAVVTGGMPKELLPLGSRTVLSRIIDEAKAAGAERVIVVGSTSKPEIDAYVKALEDPNVLVRHQERPLGLADAIASAEAHDDALILLGDTVYHGGSPCGRLADALRDGLLGAVAGEEVPDELVHLYGIIEGSGIDLDIARIVEKPKPDEVRSRWAVAARYALSAPLMAALVGRATHHRAAPRGELGLTEIINDALRVSGDPDALAPLPMRLVPLQGTERRVDCGSPEEYAEAKELSWD
jgi:UTP-glucose-1-phosphate uridylyltransferase